MWISDLMTVPESPSLLLRFLDRATGFRRKRSPPLPWMISSCRFARSPLFSPLPSFPPRWNRTRSRSKFKSERERHLHETHERDTSFDFSRTKKKEAVRTFFILDLRFHVVDRVRRLHLERDRLPGQRFHENLHCFSCCCCSLLSRARVLSNE